VKTYEATDIVYVLKRLVTTFGAQLEEEIVVIAQEIEHYILEYIRRDNEAEEQEKYKYETLINEASDSLVTILVILVGNRDRLSYSTETI
jgi:hypothetical protein